MTTLVGPMNVTRAVHPVMRRQRSGHDITISSGAGLVGCEFGTAYSASNFGLEGWMESLRPEVGPFGVHTTIVNPGYFRTELLTPESTSFARSLTRTASGLMSKPTKRRPRTSVSTALVPPPTHGSSTTSPVTVNAPRAVATSSVNVCAKSHIL